jgi:hypothetical protein
VWRAYSRVFRLSGSCLLLVRRLRDRRRSSPERSSAVEVSPRRLASRTSRANSPMRSQAAFLSIVVAAIVFIFHMRFQVFDSFGEISNDRLALLALDIAGEVTRPTQTCDQARADHR